MAVYGMYIIDPRINNAVITRTHDNYYYQYYSTQLESMDRATKKRVSINCVLFVNIEIICFLLLNAVQCTHF